MDLFTTGVLVRVVSLITQPSSFLLDRFFPMIQTEQTEEIHFDVDKSKNRITPFVSPKRAGKVVENEGFETNTFKPAYAKDKRVFDPSAPLKRAIGEQIGGNMDPMARRQVALRRSIEDQIRMLTRREEVMASEALRTGKVTVAGDGFETKVVDFGRDATLTVALAGTDIWSDAGSDPVGDIEDWAGRIQDKAGEVVTEVAMDTAAWAALRAHADVKDLLDTRRGSKSELEAGPLSAERARFTGRLGSFDLWVYNDTYVDDAGATQKMLPTGTVIMGGQGIEGTRCYGVIQDEEAGYAAERYSIKSWLEKDPAVRWLLLQSAPLVVPYKVNATLGATVL